MGVRFPLGTQITKSMENPTTGKQEKIRSFQNHSVILEGLRAYDIEGDKIPLGFRDRIRELCDKYARLPYKIIENSQELLDQAARRNPKEERELKREEIFQYIKNQLGIEFSGSDEEDLKKLLWEIMDDEDLKRRERNNFK